MANNGTAEVVSADFARQIEIDVISNQSLSNIIAVNSESSEFFSQSPRTLDLKLNIRAPRMDGFKFNVENQPDTCVSTANVDVPIYPGPSRVRRGNNLNLETRKACL